MSMDKKMSLVFLLLMIGAIYLYYSAHAGLPTQLVGVLIAWAGIIASIPSPNANLSKNTRIALKIVHGIAAVATIYLIVSFI